MDIDIALDHNAISAECYATIEKLLLDEGYAKGDQPNQFIRKINADGREIEIRLDLLAGEYEGTRKSKGIKECRDCLPGKRTGVTWLSA